VLFLPHAGKSLEDIGQYPREWMSTEQEPVQPTSPFHIKIEEATLSATVFPIAWNPIPSPSIGGPPLLPVARDPNPVTIIVIIWSIISVRRIIGTVVNRRRCPNSWRSNKEP
jgi:hypothetical protein